MIVVAVLATVVAPLSRAEEADALPSPLRLDEVIALARSRRPEIAAARADIDAALDAVAGKIPVPTARTLVGLAGSVTTVAALALTLPEYDPVAIHGSRIPVGGVRSVTAGLLTATRERRAALPVMHPGRVDVIGAGALVLRVIMDAFALDEVVVSEHDILDGIALRLARG